MVKIWQYILVRLCYCGSGTVTFLSADHNGSITAICDYWVWQVMLFSYFTETSNENFHLYVVKFLYIIFFMNDMAQK